MTNPSLSTRNPLDPDIYEWCDSCRIEKFEKDILPAMKALRWSQQLQPVVMAWVRRELVHEILNDQLIWTIEEQNDRLKAAYESSDLASQNSIDPADSDAMCLAEDALQAWSKQLWSHRLESLYLAKKEDLSLVSCSLLRVKSKFLAFELYHRLNSKECTFEQLSWEFGEGPERKQGGRFIRQRSDQLPSALYPLLKKLKTGEVLKPHQMGQWFVILSLEELLPVQFDVQTQEILLCDELKIWLTALSDYLVGHLKSLE